MFYPKSNINIVDKDYDFLTIAGVSDNKGQKRVIEAIGQLANEGLKCSYLIIGKNCKEFRKEVDIARKKYNIEIDVLDYVNREMLVSYIHKCKFFIMPSVTEGFGKVFIESIASGVPVILPKGLPLAEENGLLNNTNSIFIDDYTVDSIKSGIKCSLKNGFDNAYAISESVKSLDLKNIASQYIKIYKMHGVS